MKHSIQQAINDGELNERFWLYTNYHCNLACQYCLTESSPKAPSRLLPRDRAEQIVKEASEMGFREVGITGGEPMLLPWLPEAVTKMSDWLSVLVFSNGTLFTDAKCEQLKPWVGRPIAIQISLDHPTAIRNDAMRGEKNFARVNKAIPKLIDMGLRVRVASTGTYTEQEENALRQYVQSLGVPEADHVIRPVVERGRAQLESLGQKVTLEQLPLELTISADGAFASPFGPTVIGGQLQTDMLLSRTVLPLEKPVTHLLGITSAMPEGYDAATGIR